MPWLAGGACGARGKSSGRIGDSARTSRLHTVSFWDPLIIEAAQASGASELLSEDLQSGRRFGPLLITTPFRSG